MNSLSKREEKIQHSAKQMTWEDFLLKICSWLPVILYKNNWLVARHPDNERTNKVLSMEDFNEYREEMLSISWSPEYSFFEQFWSLLKTISLPAVIYFLENENCAFSDAVVWVKNAYLSIIVTSWSENVAYSMSVKNKCKNVFNSFLVWNESENIYFSTWIVKWYNIFFSRFVTWSSDLWYCSSMIWCSHCIRCTNLVNQSYCIDNKQLTKEEYRKKKLTLLREMMYDKESVTPDIWDAFIVNSTNSSGVHITQSNDIETWYFVQYVDWWKNLYISGSGSGQWSSNQYNGLSCGWSHHFYNVMWVWRSSEHVYCSANIIQWFHVIYSYFIDSCSYCLGCIGLENKSYCIFNKQYEKEERHEKVDEIFTSMEQQWVLWDFFPGSISPFYFNDTAAYLIDDSFTKEFVESRGYLWRDEVIAVDIPEGMDVVKTSELGEHESFQDGVLTIDPDILKKVIQDDEGNVYRIVKMEYDFLVKYGLPLPRRHRLERLKQNFKIG